MAVFGLGVMLGPILGPTLGGWHGFAGAVFYVNVPFGILCVLGILLFLGRRADGQWPDGSTGSVLDAQSRHWGAAASSTAAAA